jgi:hypothetical protein
MPPLGSIASGPVYRAAIAPITISASSRAASRLTGSVAGVTIL